MVNGRSLTILSNKLKPGTRYLLSVNMSVDNSVNNYVKYGPAYYTFTTNLPPEGGHCKIIPYDSKLLPIADEELVNTTVNPRECVYNNKSGYRGNNRLSNVFFITYFLVFVSRAMNYWKIFFCNILHHIYLCICNTYSLYI